MWSFACGYLIFNDVFYWMGFSTNWNFTPRFIYIVKVVIQFDPKLWYGKVFSPLGVRGQSFKKHMLTFASFTEFIQFKVQAIIKYSSQSLCSRAGLLTLCLVLEKYFKSTMILSTCLLECGQQNLLFIKSTCVLKNSLNNLYVNRELYWILKNLTFYRAQLCSQGICVTGPTDSDSLRIHVQMEMAFFVKSCPFRLNCAPYNSQNNIQKSIVPSSETNPCRFLYLYMQTTDLVA